MSVWHALVLGIVQGLAEFLPISSSAHLALTPLLFGWRDPGLAFDVALHLGTLLALAWYFRTEWIALAGAGVDILRQRAVRTAQHWQLVYLVIATIPGAIAGLLVKDYAETVFRAPALTAVALMVMGVLLWAADRFARRTRVLGELRARDALLVGLAQMFALVPGVSRSGSTMTAARTLGFDRPSAARFSFLMSMPITLAAVVVKTPDAVAEHGVSLPLIVGIVAAAISSWLAIDILLKYVSRYSFGIFALYRLVLGAGVLYWLSRHAG
ncbi:MAG: undecaprenyl-diphosphatase UppP [Gemmatimonadaceae bacterium]|jgi:undecaprenyl-diphosphatase|nr:undecaprenyl-diphosphatase UppP [Gemmatimonadaceae bacterium]